MQEFSSEYVLVKTIIILPSNEFVINSITEQLTRQKTLSNKSEEKVNHIAII